MATPDFTAAQVLQRAAELNNDSARAIYTDTALLPYLNSALQEMQEHLQLNEIPVIKSTSTEIEMPAGSTRIAFNVAPNPELPDNLVEIQQLWERNDGDNMQFSPMTKVDYLPPYLDDQPTSMFIFWAWEDNEVKVFESTADNIIKIQYLAQLFVDQIDDVNTTIGIINGKTYLDYRTGALAAELLGENMTRANSLNGYASTAMDRLIGIGAKGRQAIVTRRKPFRASYKSRGWT